jgi:hypothetical protein
VVEAQDVKWRKDKGAVGGHLHTSPVAVHLLSQLQHSVVATIWLSSIHDHQDRSRGAMTIQHSASLTMAVTYASDDTM